MVSNNKFNEYKDIGSYLAGLLEGDGHMDIQSDDSTSKKVNPFTGVEEPGVRAPGPRFVFIFHKNNLNMFEQLNKYIGSGFFKTGSGNSIRFVVADKQGVIKLINLMNGKLRTPKAPGRKAPLGIWDGEGVAPSGPKVITFHKLIDKVNLSKSLHIPKLPINNSRGGRAAPRPGGASSAPGLL